MKTYRVIRKCIGFKGRMWQKGQIVDLEDHEKPPHHFELINKHEEPKPVEVRGEVSTLSEMSAKIAPQSTTGFAHEYLKEQKANGEKLKAGRKKK